MTGARWGTPLCLVLALVGGTRHAHAQVALTLAGGPVNFASPVGVDFAAGSITDPTVVTFTVSVTGGAAAQRTSLVYVRAASATLGGGKALSDLQWSVASNPGVWTSVTTSDVLVEQKPIKKNTLNDPWSDQVTFRMQLHWVTDAPATYGVGLVFTLTVTTP
jgi:hypothetical protein